MNKTAKLIAGSLLAFVLSYQSAYSSPFTLQPLGSSNANALVNYAVNYSWDPTVYRNVFQYFSNETNGWASLSTVNPFKVPTSTYGMEFQLLYEGGSLAGSNNFGINTGGDNFMSVFTGGNRAGDISTIALNDSPVYSFVLDSTDNNYHDNNLNDNRGVFYSGTNNFDFREHIVALQVITSGIVNLNGRCFSLVVGDLLLFGEDLADIARTSKIDSDYDYNDMVIRVRASAIPEPATMLLFGSSLIGLGALRKSKKKL
ncbi:MAG: PEP-CTERM sorting domain-containing protein [Deltaproteobacteria bacterium]|nr:PEP-CTERM sorting domain-containing protein [Deltaproteobacteria bacterium]